MQRIQSHLRSLTDTGASESVDAIGVSVGRVRVESLSVEEHSVWLEHLTIRRDRSSSASASSSDASASASASAASASASGTPGADSSSSGIALVQGQGRVQVSERRKKRFAKALADGLVRWAKEELGCGVRVGVADSQADGVRVPSHAPVLARLASLRSVSGV